MDMTPQRWQNTRRYLADTFGQQDKTLATLMPRAIAAGLPDIAVSPDVGRLLSVLTQLACARPGATGVAVELGTLGGYSGIWIARGLSGPTPRLITVDPNPQHADFAESMFREAGVADRVRVRREKGLEALPRLLSELGPRSIDVLFLDAIKVEYPDYFRVGRELIGVGGLLLADNVLGSTFWIDDAPGSTPERDAVDRFNRMVAADPGFETVAAANGHGLLIARRMS